MPIARLPPKTVHTISSSQVLTDSCSVVKELIDNSLDAESDAIFVEISLNALDIVQVRDNGHGIIPDDRPMVGKRHCTSKIRDLADLESIGGKCLGFRGEALASAAELSASMIISTRTEGEAAAVSLTIGRKGEIAKEERTSLPVGTTVRINGFLNAIPVRRQTALKTSSKSLIKIKKLLQAYALARPSVRFALKVLKAKNDNANWIYAPKSGEHVLEAARRIIGRDVVDQCQWKTHESIRADADAGADENLVANGDSGSAEGSYKIEALLPKSKYDPHVISNAGQFISVDSRPVSCTRGTFKLIIGLYKSYLGSGTLVERSDKPKNPVLCMHLSCPRASYDVNVEPAKDDVLFTNVDLVLGVVKQFFKDIYGEIPTKPLKNAGSVAANTKPRGFEVLLARKREPLASAPNKTSPHLGSNSGVGASIRSRPPVNVPKHAFTFFDGYSNTKSGDNLTLSGVTAASSQSNRLPVENPHVGDLTADAGSAKEHSLAQRRQPNAYLDAVDMLSSPLHANRRTDRAHDLDGEEALRDPSVSSPWTFAKINTPIRQRDASRRVNNQLLTPGYQTGELDEIIGRQVHVVKESLKPNRHGLPTPQRTHARQHGFSTFHSSSPGTYPLSADHSGLSTRKTNESNHFLAEHPSHSFSTLDSWIQRPSDDDPTISNSGGLDSFDQQDEEISVPNTRNFVSARTILMGNPRDGFSQLEENLSLRSSPPESFPRAEPTIQLHLPDNNLRDDSVRPFSPGELAQYTPGARCDRNSASAAASVSTEDQDIECTSQPNSLSSIPYIHPDLAKTLDYEMRKQAAVKQWKASQNLRLVQNKSSQRPISSVPSPHQNRYRRALASLRQPVDDSTEDNPAAALGYHDPRAYLIRRQEQDKSDEFPLGSRKRRKTSSLPLEKVHEQSSVRDLTYMVDTIGINLSKNAGNCASSGELYDRYIISGTIAPGISSQGLTCSTVRTWEEKVRKLLKISYETDKTISEVGRMEAKINLWPLIQTHLAIYP